MIIPYKILTKIEAEIRQDFVRSVASKKRDVLSQHYIAITKKYRKVSERLSVLADKVRLEDIIMAIRDYLKNHSLRSQQSRKTLRG